MSTIYLYILFCVFLLNFPKYWKIAIAAAIDYNDYNYLDTANKDLKDYLEKFLAQKKTQPFKDKFEYAAKKNINEPNYIDDNYPSECKPPFEMTTQSITTTSSSSSPPQDNSSTSHECNTTNAKPNHYFETSDKDALKEAQDVIDHVTRLIKSMRQHVIALIKNMNELETDILSSNYTDIDNLMGSRNATNFEDESTMYERKNIKYPDILSQTPGYVINEWSAPVKTVMIPGTQETNEFMEEAQEAVRSWKHEIENCKHILDSAVSKALETSDLKSNLITAAIGNPSLKSSGNSDAVSGQRKLLALNHKMAAKEQLEKFKKVRSNGPRKYNGLYESLHSKNHVF